MDRKGWIILIICGILLALNWHFMPKQEPKPLEAKDKQTTEKNAQPPTGDKNSSTNSDSTDNTGLTVEKPVPTVGENTQDLVSYIGEGKDRKKNVTYTITSKGGGIKSALLHNQLAVGSKNQHIILNEDSPAPIGTFGEGPDDFLGLDYDLTRDEKTNAIYADATTTSGLRITKLWQLVQDESQPGAPWTLTLKVTFRNQSKSSINLQNYSFFNGAASPLHLREWVDQGGAFYLGDGDFTNASSSPGEEMDKGFFHSARSIIKESTDNLQYAGVSNQFFTTIVRPEESFASSFWAKSSPITMAGASADKPMQAVRSGFTLPAHVIEPDEKKTLSFSIYIGPKRYSILDDMEGQSAEVMNYGMFSFVSVPLNIVLNFFHDVVFSNTADKWAWGLSIIALTILIRIVIWPLHNKSTRTMKRMSKLQPLMKDLREKYKDNPTKLNQETMRLYKEYQINPMGGCLPMFLQIPIFFGYYRMLQYAVELRGQSFLWVDDLSMPDTIYSLDLPFSLPFLGNVLPINLLPILMAVTMVLQMKMTPNTGDKMQRRIFMLMPLMFFFFCYNFASALALYWTTQNIFSIGQTWLMNRMPEPELTKRKSGKPGKKSFMERMAERAEEMQRAQEAARKGEKPNPNNMRNATPDKKKKRPPRTGG